MNSINKYLNIKQIKRLLYLLATICFLLMVFMEYDIEFKSSILLPIWFAICLGLFVKAKLVNGVGSSILILTYAFRMCILPVLCAYGNFFLEPDREIYISYFNAAIVLMCLENFIIFLSLYGFGNYYHSKPANTISKCNNRVILKWTTIILLLIYLFTILVYPIFISRFHFIVAEKDSALQQDIIINLQGYGAMYYINVLMEILGRPLLSFALVEYFLNKNSKKGYLLAGLIGIINIVFCTDRRILSLLIGAGCLFQVLAHSKRKMNKKIMYGLMAIMAIITIIFCFYGEDTSIRIARKFQRYFSGPSLTAIGMGVFDNFQQNFMDFIQRLFNDSILLTGIFGSFSVKDYVVELCGLAGKSIWTPMTIGSIQYFGIFFPIILMFIVWFIVDCDYRAKKAGLDFHMMIYNYLSISIAVYMVMYSVELIIYNILFIGMFYKIILYFDNCIRLKKYSFKISHHKYKLKKD